MDPNVALQQLREAVADEGAVDAAQRMAESFRALDEWLSKGGFAPQAWMEAKIDRQAKAQYWNARLTEMLDDRLEDGTHVLEIVFARNPQLHRRLKETLDKAIDDAIQRGRDEAAAAEPLRPGETRW